MGIAGFTERPADSDLLEAQTPLSFPGKLAYLSNPIATAKTIASEPRPTTEDGVQQRYRLSLPLKMRHKSTLMGRVRA
ncbi:hypothetical protein FCULG_00003545 [Fusarium culmorum]|uniref:Uncharacterized protein n=1 Tax=Fusarium culmorum TaxID=5516 RepID=A0A2T4H7H5_FUSCU|nr:hypothetical protein FCULG_00003545 [Fusarium culmorum]